MRRKMLEPLRVQALYRSKHVFEAIRVLAVNPQFAEALFAKRMPESPQALLQYFLPMRHKQKPRSRKLLTQACIVDRGHHCLASAGRCDKQISMVPLLSRRSDLFE